MKPIERNSTTKSENDLAWYEEQVQLGLDDLKAGRVISDEEHRRRVAETLTEIRSRHAGRKKAA